MLLALEADGYELDKVNFILCQLLLPSFVVGLTLASSIASIGSLFSLKGQMRMLAQMKKMGKGCHRKKLHFSLTALKFVRAFH